MAHRLVLVFLAALLIGGRCAPDEVRLGDLVLRVEAVSKRPLGRGRFGVTYAAVLHNPTAVDLGDVVVEAASDSRFVRVVEGRLRFPAVGAGETRSSDAPLLVSQKWGRWSVGLAYTLSSAAPALLGSVPSDGAAEVARSDWPVLRFAERPSSAARAGFGLACGGAAVPFAVHALGAGSLLLNPAPELPPAANCRVGWIGPENEVHALDFATATAGPEALVHYDRTDPTRNAPMPDDVFTTPDPTTRTGLRVQIPVPTIPGTQALSRALLARTVDFDGFSPHGPIVIRLSDVPDPSRVPRDAAAALDPLSPIVLLDLSPGRPSEGRRVPFATYLRSDRVAAGPLEHALILFPSIQLEPGGRYGLVVTRRLLVDPSRPFGPSPYFMAALAPPLAGEDASLARVRPLTEEVLAAAATAEPPIAREDVALALRFTTHTNDTIPLAPLAMRAQLAALPPPAFSIDDVRPGSGHIAAIVHGTFESPDWRDDFGNVSRDANGLPQMNGIWPIPFVLALPDEPGGRAPLVIAGHGNPGSAESGVPGAASGLSEGGFAVLGTTHPLDREAGQDLGLQRQAIFTHLLFRREPPGYWLQGLGEKLATLRLIPELADLDLLPLGSPDGVPDLDVGAPLAYYGVSHGSVQGQMWLPYAPEIRAASLTVGFARTTEVMVYEEGVRSNLPELIGRTFPNVVASELWAGLAAFQLILDPQESQSHAAFLFRQPLEVDGTTRKPSILMTEGLGDSYAPPNALHASAHTLGLPLVAPVWLPTPILDVVSAPVQANVDPLTTKGLFQYVPQGYPGLPPSPGCETLSEGHFCADFSPAVVLQRVRFFESALGGEAPLIVDPFAEDTPAP